MSDRDSRDGEVLLARLADGDLLAGGLLADWLEERGDPRGPRLRKEWTRRELAARNRYALPVGMSARTLDQVLGRTAITLHWYALRLLSVRPGAVLPRADVTLTLRLLWPGDPELAEEPEPTVA